MRADQEHVGNLGIKGIRMVKGEEKLNIARFTQSICYSLEA
jgi:hypothetical protein